MIVSALAFALLRLVALAPQDPATQDPGSSGAVRVTYTADAKVKRGPNDPVLPKGSVPCGGYPETGKGILRLSERMKPPQRTKFTSMDMSKLAPADAHTFGILFGEVIVSAQGRVSEIKILRSVSPSFDQLFVDELASSKFRPATLNGRAVSVCIVYTARPEVR